MRDLSLVALHEDGESLVLEDAEGGRYALPVDERLRSALRGDRARLGQLSIELESSLRPAEIQARIRAGASAEDVAREAGVPVERVRRYEGPVVAEREHVARLARGALVGRRDGGERAPLADVVEPRLAERGVPPEGLDWDAHRRDDGRWVVVLRWSTAAGKTAQGGRPRAGSATWLFDVRTRALSAGGDEARWLVDGEPAELATAEPPAAHPRSAEDFAERPYDERPYDEGAGEGGPDEVGSTAQDGTPGPADEPDEPAEPDVRAEDGSPGATVVGLDALLEAGSNGHRGRRGRRGRGVRPTLAPDSPAAPDPVAAADADGSAGTAGADEPGSPERAQPVPGPVTEPPVGAQPAAVPAADASAQDEPKAAADEPVADEPATEEQAAAEPARPAARQVGGARGRRAAMPSWDEIVFGRKRD